MTRTKHICCIICSGSQTKTPGNIYTIYILYVYIYIYNYLHMHIYIYTHYVVNIRMIGVLLVFSTYRLEHHESIYVDVYEHWSICNIYNLYTYDMKFIQKHMNIYIYTHTYLIDFIYQHLLGMFFFFNHHRWSFGHHQWWPPSRRMGLDQRLQLMEMELQSLRQRNGGGGPRHVESRDETVGKNLWLILVNGGWKKL